MSTPTAAHGALPERFIGISESADFEKDTWTFTMEPGYIVGAGRYVIQLEDALAPTTPVPAVYAMKWPSDNRIDLCAMFDTEDEARRYLERCAPGVSVVPLYTAPPAALSPASPAPAVPSERSVTSILLSVVPGDDGMGLEVYAKSVEDVEDALTRIGGELEDWQLGIKRLPPAQQTQSDAVAAIDDVIHTLEHYNPAADKYKGQYIHKGLADLLRAALAGLATPPQQAKPTMQDALAAGDGTLHETIDYWQRRALAAEDNKRTFHCSFNPGGCTARCDVCPETPSAATSIKPDVQGEAS